LILEHLQAGQRMFSKLEAKKYCDKRTSSQSLPSGSSRKLQAADKRIAITPTTHLTPTTSNASSGTPTPQPNRLQSRGPQRSLPTPPASTHSSSGTIRHGISRSSIDIDINQLKADASRYKFDRHNFADKSTKHVRLYNNLLKLQRIKMQKKRQNVAVQPEHKLPEIMCQNQDKQMVDKVEETLVQSCRVTKGR